MAHSTFMWNTPPPCSILHLHTEHFLFLYVAPFSCMIVVVGQGVYRGCVKMHQETTCARIPSALIEFFRNLLAVLLAATFVFVLLVCKLMLRLLCSILLSLFLNLIPTNFRPCTSFLLQHRQFQCWTGVSCFSACCSLFHDYCCATDAHTFACFLYLFRSRSIR